MAWFACREPYSQPETAGEALARAEVCVKRYVRLLHLSYQAVRSVAHVVEDQALGIQM